MVESPETDEVARIKEAQKARKCKRVHQEKDKVRKRDTVRRTKKMLKARKRPRWK